MSLCCHVFLPAAYLKMVASVSLICCRWVWRFTLLLCIKIRWQDMVPDSEVLTKVSIPSVHTLLWKAQVRLAGHVKHMPDDHLPKQPLCGELCESKYSAGGQQKNQTSRTPWKCPGKASTLRSFSWETLTCDWSSWHGRVLARVLAAEKQRIAEVQRKCAA